MFEPVCQFGKPLSVGTLSDSVCRPWVQTCEARPMSAKMMMVKVRTGHFDVIRELEAKSKHIFPNERSNKTIHSK